MLQYAMDKVLVHISERDLLIINDWQIVKRLEEPDDSNTKKYWMRPIPGFHETEFPFIICNGWDTFNIVNVHDYYMEPIINCSTRTGLSQEAAVFIETDFGF